MAESNASPQAPPPALDCTRVLEYAVLDSTVSFSGRSLLFVNGQELGAVRRLAICADMNSSDVMLFHCSDDWRVLGCSAHKSVVEARGRAEHIYRGVSALWTNANVSPEQAESYLDELFGGQHCSKCGRRAYQVNSLMQSGSDLICDQCKE